jgi:hypothetical protein
LIAIGAIGLALLGLLFTVTPLDALSGRARLIPFGIAGPSGALCCSPFSSTAWSSWFALDAEGCHVVTTSSGQGSQ